MIFVDKTWGVLDLHPPGLWKIHVYIYTLDLPPTQDAIVANEVLGWDSQFPTKKCKNPGGDFNPGWGG